MVELVRVSLGTAITLGLVEGRMDTCQKTAFLMTYGKCRANCAFCPQARESSSSEEMLSRISWKEYHIDNVVRKWSKTVNFSRICVQTLNYENVVEDVIQIVTRLKRVSEAPLSVSIHPVSSSEMKKLVNIGVDNLGIAIDACTPPLFDEIKGEKRSSPYRWKSHIAALEQALNIFGEGKVTTHLIIGVGESEEEAANFIFSMYNMGVSVGLFAFTSVKGTDLEGKPQPELGKYRRLQILRYLVASGQISRDEVGFSGSGHIEFKCDLEVLKQSLSSGNSFLVSGCKGCNRPYYNERPRGPMYNYPRPLSQIEVHEALKEAGLVT